MANKKRLMPIAYHNTVSVTLLCERVNMTNNRLTQKDIATICNALAEIKDLVEMNTCGLFIGNDSVTKDELKYWLTWFNVHAYKISNVIGFDYYGEYSK